MSMCRMQLCRTLGSRCFSISRILAAKLEIGMQGEATTKVVQGQNTADFMKSGDLEVFSTPCMVALMEEAACAALAPGFEEGETSVGTGIAVSHTAATAVGATVSATARLSYFKGKSIVFAISATDSTGTKIGQGTHSRAVVKREPFMARLAKKSA